jgi:hypothetical protein
MKSFRVSPLDRRHKGHKYFSHYVMPIWTMHLEDKLRYFEWRNWCWDTWGPGLERDMAVEWNSKAWGDEVKWAWHTDDGAKRLYFATEKELNWFNLRWASE